VSTLGTSGTSKAGRGGGGVYLEVATRMEVPIGDLHSTVLQAAPGGLEPLLAAPGSPWAIQARTGRCRGDVP